MGINAPQQYINEDNSTQKAGKYIAPIHKKALIVGGKRALEQVGNAFYSSLAEEGITYQTEVYGGRCTKKDIDRYVEFTNNADVGVVIGVGGGKVMDLVKSIGEHTNLPVVTIPTIAATCAAWAALTVVYTEEGAVSEFRPLKSSPQLILVDSQVIAKAPTRYLKAGIADTIVKWYEFVPYFKEDSYDTTLRISLNTAKLALEILNENSAQAIADNEQGRSTVAFKQVVDAIISLAGLTGSIRAEDYLPALAHEIHNSMTKIEETHGNLHGEKVIFGLIAQFILEGKSKEEIQTLIDQLTELDLPVTLNQLGIKQDAPVQVHQIAQGINLNPKGLSRLSFEVNCELIERAILKADELGEAKLKISTI